MGEDNHTILRPGSLFGAYRVLKRLGKGGMGEVYLVEDESQHRKYAVKVLDPESHGRDPEFLKRFIRESEFAMRVRHPNLVEVYDAGIDPESGICYLTMEYLPGGSLRDLLAQRVEMSFPGVMTIATDIARALLLVERNGMVHRDVKPDNIMFAADGSAKLTDLGISRFSYGSDVAATQANGMVGTPAYMAPEQMLDAHAVDIRADIYSLGIVMYEMITGHRPTEGQNAMRTLAKAIDGQSFPDVRYLRPDTPVYLARLVSKMTLPAVQERPESAWALLGLLSHPERILRAEDLPPPPPPRPPWYRDRGVLYAATAMILATSALLVALVTVFTRD